MVCYAFDIDGTLTRRGIRDLANNLHAAKHVIYVITGGLSSTEITDEELQQRINLREKQLEDLGVKYDELFVCIGKTTHEVAMQKAEVCRIQKPVIIFEDTPMYVAVIEQRSKTIGLLVTKIK